MAKFKFLCPISENIHTHPWKVIGNSEGVGRGIKVKTFKGTYGAKLEFPEGWGGSSQKEPSVGEGPGGGYSKQNWVGVCGPLPKTLTLFMTKICDFPYPNYDLK